MRGYKNLTRRWLRMTGYDPIEVAIIGVVLLIILLMAALSQAAKIGNEGTVYGYDGVYDGSVIISRDAAGVLTLDDATVSPITLSTIANPHPPVSLSGSGPLSLSSQTLTQSFPLSKSYGGFGESVSSATGVPQFITGSLSWITSFSHNTQLSGLQGGAANDYYHLTGAQHTDLTDGGASALHYHVDASVFATGDLPDARLTDNVPLLDKEINYFTGEQSITGSYQGYAFAIGYSGGTDGAVLAIRQDNGAIGFGTGANMAATDTTITRTAANELTISNNLKTIGSITIGADDSTVDTLVLGGGTLTWDDAADNRYETSQAMYVGGTFYAGGQLQALNSLFCSANGFAEQLRSVGSSYANTVYQRARAGTTAVADTDILGTIGAAGYDGNSYAAGGGIGFRVNGTPGDGDMPTAIYMSVSADGTESPAEHFTMTANGMTELDTTADQIPPLKLDANDSDTAFIKFEGTAGAGNSINATEKSTFAGMLQIDVNGTKYWLKAYAD